MDVVSKKRAPPVMQFPTGRAFFSGIDLRSQLIMCESLIWHEKWARQDSDLRPSDYESPALTTAPRALAIPTMMTSAFPSVAVHEDLFLLVVMQERATGFEPANISLEG
jgi:hypothetical protein